MIGSVVFGSPGVIPASLPDSLRVNVDHIMSSPNLKIQLEISDNILWIVVRDGNTNDVLKREEFQYKVDEIAHFLTVSKMNALDLVTLENELKSAADSIFPQV
jgi:hypothetical protein